MNGVLSSVAYASRRSFVVAVVLCVVASLALLASMIFALISTMDKVRLQSDHDRLSGKVAVAEERVEELTARLEKVKNSPEMAEYTAQEAQVQQWCDSVGLGVYSIEPNDRFKKVSILPDLKYAEKIAEKKCADKAHAYKATPTMGALIESKLRVDSCTSFGDGGIEFLAHVEDYPLDLVPVAARDVTSVDLRFALQSFQDGQLVETSHVDVLAQPLGQGFKIEGRLPTGGLTSGTCRVSYVSWWPHGL